MRIFPRILTILFLLGWVLFIFLDYWQKHPSYYLSFVHFQYSGMALALLAIGAGSTWLVLKYGRIKQRAHLFNGLAVFLLMMVVSLVTVGAAFNALVPGGGFNAMRAIHVLGQVGGTALAVYSLALATYVLGSFINDFLNLKIDGLEGTMIAIATGIMGLVLFSFLLGAIGLLHGFLLYPCLAVLLFFGRKKALFFLKKSLWQPLATDSGLSWVGAGSFFLLVLLMGINFTAVNVPMPAGFDSLTVYANLPSLIGGQHGLVEGFQPYNWSILMSLGYVLFNSTEVSLALSNLGGILAAFALYALCRRWLKLDANYSLLAILAFSITPAVTVQSSAELKIDLGLLFVSLCILLVLLDYVGSGFGKNETAKTAADNGKTAIFKKLPFPPEIAWMGLMSGFALGIKLTTTYFAFALLIALWYAYHGRRGFWAMFLASLFLVFLVKLDDFGGLRQFHLGAGLLQWGILAAALLLFAGSFLANSSHFQKSLKLSVVYGAFALLTFVPWVVKNFAETRSLSPTALMNGKAASPDISLPILEKNLSGHGN